jgi:hypothetical protein
LRALDASKYAFAFSMQGEQMAGKTPRQACIPMAPRREALMAVRTKALALLAALGLIVAA